MATVADNAGPWGMQVYSFEPQDPANPLGRLRPEDLSRLPFGALELDNQGRVVSFHDTEPDGGSEANGVITGRLFFTEIAKWLAQSLVADEFAKGVANSAMNVVFDCAVPSSQQKIRIHLKVSPILGTFWVFIKRLRQN